MRYLYLIEFISALADKETHQLLPEDKTDIRNEFTKSKCDRHNILDAYDYFYELIMSYINQDKGNLGEEGGLNGRLAKFLCFERSKYIPFYPISSEGKGLLDLLGPSFIL